MCGLVNGQLNYFASFEQVNDGFNVKFTKDHSETISYLVAMTRGLVRKYEGVVLTRCGREDLGDRGDDCLMTYPDFESGSRKTTNFTVREMFLKHLLQFSGMSVANALAITQHYPTLLSLTHAYLPSLGIKERINLIARIKPHSAHRAVGPALAKKLMTTYSRDIPLIPPKIAKNSCKISKNSGKIAKNSGKISTNSGKIAENSALIAENSDRIPIID